MEMGGSLQGVLGRRFFHRPIVVSFGTRLASESAMANHRAEVRGFLKQRRDSLGLSQAEAARRCGVARTVYAHAENGTVPDKMASLERLLDLVEGLGLESQIVFSPVRHKTQKVH